MKKVVDENSTREELINALIDLFNIREPIEAYLEWLERPFEDLLYIYNCGTSEYDDYEDFGDCYYV